MPASIHTTFYPTTYFARRIVADAAEVVCPVPADADPVLWRPDESAVEGYQQAGLIVVNGAGFEAWTDVVTLPASRLVDTTADLDCEFLYYETTTHRHGPTGDDSHEGIDGHTWLDPLIATQQAEAIAAAAARAWPDAASRFEANVARLKDDLAGLDSDLRTLSARLHDVNLVCSQPAYNYLARRYSWTVENMNLPPDRELSAEALQTLAAKQAESDRLTIVLWEAAPAATVVAQLKRHSVRSVVFEPGESEPASGDYLSLMRDNISRFSEAIGP